MGWNTNQSSPQSSKLLSISQTRVTGDPDGGDRMVWYYFLLRSSTPLIVFLIKGCVRDSCACSRPTWSRSIGCSISNYDHWSKWVDHFTTIYATNLCNSFKYPAFRHWGRCVYTCWATYRASVANRCDECCSCLSTFECHSWDGGNGGNDRL